MNMRSIVGVACAAVAITAAVAFADGDVVTPNFEQAIPNTPGKSLIAVVVEAFIFAYVLAGEIESQVNDGPRRVYRAGESFYETPGSSHPISRNASKTEPAKLLAVFVVDTNDKPLTTPVKYYHQGVKE